MEDDNFLRKLLSAVSSSKHKTETQEDALKRLVNEAVQNQLSSHGAVAAAVRPTVPASSSTNTDVMENLLKVLNFQVDHAISEKTELETEKLKRLQAEREVEELRRQLQNNASKNDNSAPPTKPEKEDDIQELVRLLSSLKSEAGKENLTQSSSNEKGKCYADPAWFPGSSKSGDSLNHSSESVKEKNFNKDCFNPGAVHNNQYPSGNMNYQSFPGYSGPVPGQMGPYPSHSVPFTNSPSAPFPPQPFHGKPGHFPPQQHPPPMNNPFQFQQQPQFPFNANNIFPPHLQQNATGRPQQGTNFRQQQQPPRPKVNNQQKFPKPKNTQKPNETQPVNQPPQAQGEKKKTRSKNKNKSSQNNTDNNINNLSEDVKCTKDLDSLNLTEQDMQNVKDALHAKKVNDCANPQGNKTAFKKKNKRKTNQLMNGEGNEDDDSDNGNSNATAVPTPSAPPLPPRNVNNPPKPNEGGAKKKANPQGPSTPQPKQQNNPPSNATPNAGGAKKKNNAQNAEGPNTPQPKQQNNPPSNATPNAGGAKKKNNPQPAQTAEGVQPVPPRKNKNKNPNQNANGNGQNPTQQSNSKSDVNFFVGEKFPTMGDVTSGRLKMTDKVKNILMVADIDGDIHSEKAYTVSDMIVFHSKYPNAKMIAMK